MSAAYTFDPAIHLLGNPCRNGHMLADTGLCPRTRGKDRKGKLRPGNCVICRAQAKRWLSEDYAQWRLADANLKGKGEQLILQRHLKSLNVPSVADLVREQQLLYWLQDRKACWAERFRMRRHRWQFRYLTDERFRLAHLERGSRRHVAKKANTFARLTAAQIVERFDAFGHACAYCKCTGDLHQDHFLPISKGGTHVLSNIIPACQPCNYSKRDHDPETWYQAQSFFSEKRWRIILTVTGKRKGAIGQLALI
jgi:5-methylcytosine-specific restriction endonuclease McrA